MLRWGILGAARINRSLVPAFAASSRNHLVAVASRGPARARAFADTWGVARAHGCYEDLLDDPGVDAVYVPLPNGLHVEWTTRAARAGKHVLCEKPLALDATGVDAVEAAAREAGVVVAEAFMYRHHPQTLRVKELVDSGAIGEPGLVRGAFSFSLDRPGDVRLDPALGGGSLWDVGCYPVSYARYVLALEPDEVFGRARLGPTGVDVAFAGQLRFPGDVLAQFDSGLRAPLRVFMEFVGSEGTLRVAAPFKPGPGAPLELRRGDRVEAIGVEEGGLYERELEDFADAALLGRPPRISLAESRGNAAALAALARSSREGGPVRL
jgi:D-xylose 1-dehydrogenase (NADP+, D-xylono-1,5-lactone-forming)